VESLSSCYRGPESTQVTSMSYSVCSEVAGAVQSGRSIWTFQTVLKLQSGRSISTFQTVLKLQSGRSISTFQTVLKLQSGRSIPFIPRWWRQQVSLKCRFANTRLHAVTFRQTATATGCSAVSLASSPERSAPFMPFIACQFTAHRFGRRNSCTVTPEDTFIRSILFAGAMWNCRRQYGRTDTYAVR